VRILQRQKQLFRLGSAFQQLRPSQHSHSTGAKPRKCSRLRPESVSECAHGRRSGRERRAPKPLRLPRHGRVKRFPPNSAKSVGKSATIREAKPAEAAFGPAREGSGVRPDTATRSASAVADRRVKTTAACNSRAEAPQSRGHAAITALRAPESDGGPRGRSIE
jgi:hypothetical protein